MCEFVPVFAFLGGAAVQKFFNQPYHSASF
jgi:hypothetical protein